MRQLKDDSSHLQIAHPICRDCRVPMWLRPGRARADEPQSTKNVRLSARHVATWFATDSEGWKLSNDGSGRHAFIRF
jgi:hypothetical protein